MLSLREAVLIWPAESTILRVYLPCANLELENYCKHLVDLESLSQIFGPGLIAGNFNTHLGSLGDIRGWAIPNQQGVLLKKFLDQCELYALSLSCLSEGLFFPFWLERCLELLVVTPLTAPFMKKN